MEEKKERTKKTPAAEKSTKGTRSPKAKQTKRVPKKEYVVVLVKQSAVILTSGDGFNIKVAKTAIIKDVKIGDKVRL